MDGGETWRIDSVVKDISFDLRQGEILGISGLMGSGRTELVQSIFGEYGRRLSGELLLGGEPIEIRSSQDAIHHGLALLTEDRKGTSLVLKHSVLTNATLPSLPDLVNWSIIDSNKELAVAYHYQEKLQIKTPTIHALVNSLSGGNQQKVALAKWLMTEPKILIMDEPTRELMWVQSMRSIA